MPEGAAAERLDAVFGALADARRRGMIEGLSGGPRSVKELAGPLSMALPSAVKHLAVLERARLVRSEKSGRVRRYRLAEDAFADVEAWVEARKSALNAQFDRLDAWLARSGGEEA